MIKNGPRVAVIDFGMGNLHSIAQALIYAGMRPELVTAPSGLDSVAAVILPGVGGFPEAMARLHRQDLVAPLRYFSKSGAPVLGICLGMQLLLTTSSEFGITSGLGLIPGEVLPLPISAESGARRLKRPAIGWRPIHWTADRTRSSLTTSLFCHLSDNDQMYLVHSYFARPTDESTVLALADHGDFQYPVVICSGNTIGVQYHPERSGTAGLQTYQGLSRWLSQERRASV